MICQSMSWGADPMDGSGMDRSCLLKMLSKV